MLVGALIGIPLLLALPPEYFNAVVPWLIVVAGGLAIAQPWLTGNAQIHGNFEGSHRRLVLVLGVTVAGVYLSYFGAATGVITLFILLYVGIHDLQIANAIKNLITGIVNAVIAIVFLIAAPVDVLFAVVIAMGSALGGYLGGKIAQKLSLVVFRVVIGVVALSAAIVATTT